MEIKRPDMEKIMVKSEVVEEQIMYGDKRMQ